MKDEKKQKKEEKNGKSAAKYEGVKKGCWAQGCNGPKVCEGGGTCTLGLLPPTTAIFQSYVCILMAIKLIIRVQRLVVQAWFGATTSRCSLLGGSVTSTFGSGSAHMNPYPYQGHQWWVARIIHAKTVFILVALCNEVVFEYVSTRCPAMASPPSPMTRHPPRSDHVHAAP